MKQTVPWNEEFYQEFSKLAMLSDLEKEILRMRIMDYPVSEMAITVSKSESLVHQIIKELRQKYDSVQPLSNRLPKRKFSIEDYEFLKKLEVKKEDKEKLEIIADKIHGVYFGSKDENKELGESTNKYYNILSRAIKEHRKVQINYYSYTNGNQDRIIRPYDMFLFNNGWGCAAYCELKKDLRHFELKRINNIELLDEKF